MKFPRLIAAMACICGSWWPADGWAQEAAPARDRRLVVNEALVRAEALAREGQIEDALRLLEAASAVDPTRFEVPALAALVTLQGGLPDQALHLAREAQKLAPPDQQAKVRDLEPLIERVRQALPVIDARAARTVDPGLAQQRSYAHAMHLLASAQNVQEPEARQILLSEFLRFTGWYVKTYPNDRNMWGLIGTVALELNRRDEGTRARAALQRLGLDDDNPAEAKRLRALTERLRDRWRTEWPRDEMTRKLAAEPWSLGVKGAKWENSLGIPFAVIGGVYMAMVETPVYAYYEFARSTGQSWTWADWQTPTHPAVAISWTEAKQFCRWLTYRERLLGRISNTQSYRLPTDAEWSLAVGMAVEPGATPHQRHNKVKHFAWGAAGLPPARFENLPDGSLLEVEPARTVLAGYQDTYPFTAPVASFKMSAQGLFDLVGNVRELCEERYDPAYSAIVVRGGSWAVGNKWEKLASGTRYGLEPGERATDVGFRLVLAEETR